MKILISNDDGVFSEGLRALAQMLSKHFSVTVVGPEMQRSGASHASSFTEPVRVRKVTLPECPDVVAYATTGTPADCVRLGCTSLGIDPDLVVTGINHGENLGTHVHYSGTVGAAMEAAFAGKSAIASSCCHYDPTDFSAAAVASLWAVNFVRNNPLPPAMILNLNTPHLPISEIKGIKLAKLHFQKYDSEHAQFEDPFGRKFFWTKFEPRTCLPHTEDNDLYWAQAGYVTLTPIHCDITCYSYMKTMDVSGFDLTRFAPGTEDT